MDHRQQLALVQYSGRCAAWARFVPHRLLVLAYLGCNAQQFATAAEGFGRGFAGSRRVGADGHGTAHQRAVLGFGHLQVLGLQHIEPLLIRELQELAFIEAERRGIQRSSGPKDNLRRQAGGLETEDAEPGHRMEAVADVDGLGRSPDPPDGGARLDVGLADLHRLVDRHGIVEELRRHGRRAGGPSVANSLGCLMTEGSVEAWRWSGRGWGAIALHPPHLVLHHSIQRDTAGSRLLHKRPQLLLDGGLMVTKRRWKLHVDPSQSWTVLRRRCSGLLYSAYSPELLHRQRARSQQPGGHHSHVQHRGGCTQAGGTAVQH